MDNLSIPPVSSGTASPLQRLGGVVPVGRPSPSGSSAPASGAHSSSSPPPIEGLPKEQGTESLESLLPASILRSTRWMATEWAWRRAVFQSDNLPTETKNLQSLWKVLEGLASGSEPTLGTNTSVGRWHFDVAKRPVESNLLPFTQVDFASLKELPAKLHPLVLADRLQASVQSPDLPWAGGGLFFPSEPSANGRETAVRWEAERQTKTGTMGQLIHRLEIRVQLGRDPLQISLLFAAPHLDIHFGVDNPVLQTALMDQAVSLRATLAEVGVNVERVHSGPMATEQED